MNLLKLRIAHSFNKAEASYDNHCFLQSAIADELILRLRSFINFPAYILDAGCGTGNSTKKLIDNLPYKKIWGLDIAEKLLARAKSKQLDASFIIADFDRHIFHGMDLVYSNMALQWSADIGNSLRVFKGELREGGLIAFSLPLEMTFCEIEPAHRNKFCSFTTIKNSLSLNDLEILSSWENNYVLDFDSQIEALRSIKLVGANCLVNQSKRTRLRMSEAKLTYHIGFFIARKCH